jgi:hypothetical protein
MKTISIWQPFASLIVSGCKVFETRTWPAPASRIGERIGIAATKTILPAQRAHIADPDFQRAYATTGQPVFEDLPRGMLLGYATLDSVEMMTEELMNDVSEEEKLYGWWELGNYAWRLTNPVAFKQPCIIRGQQGIYDWRGVMPE